ncbi:hypothetical protein EDD86DRAFT_205118 [Gorgonomyces haynaldii]|nr:hypothetical protein EDD86DRAFT_205118 [Gorgonomyces haynaldii]
MEAEICEWAKSLGYKTEESKLEFVGLETESAQSLCTAPLLPVWKHLLTRVKPKKTVDSVRSQLYSAVLAKDPNDIPESLRTSFERVKEQALKRQQLIDKYDNIRQQNSEKRAARLDLEQELETRIKMHREQSSALREMEHQAKMEQDRLTVCETIISKIESIESALHHHQTQELGSLETPVSRIDINSRFDVPELSEQASRDTLKLVTPMNKLYVDTYFETGQASFKAQRAKDQVGEKMKELDDYLSKMSCSEEEKRTLHDKIEAQALHSMHLHLKMQLEDALEEIETQKPFEERIEAAQEQVREKLEALVLTLTSGPLYNTNGPIPSRDPPNIIHCQ